MSEATEKGVRLSKVAREFNLGLHTVVEFLEKKGHPVESNPNTKIPGDLYDLLQDEFGTDKEIKEKSLRKVQQRQERETISLVPPPKEPVRPKEETPEPPPPPAERPAETPAASTPPPAEQPPAPAPDRADEVIKPKVEKPGVKVVSKIDR